MKTIIIMGMGVKLNSRHILPPPEIHRGSAGEFRDLALIS
jgi:hypothetical protein